MFSTNTNIMATICIRQSFVAFPFIINIWDLYHHFFKRLQYSFLSFNENAKINTLKFWSLFIYINLTSPHLGVYPRSIMGKAFVYRYAGPKCKYPPAGIFIFMNSDEFFKSLFSSPNWTCILSFSFRTHGKNLHLWGI